MAELTEYCTLTDTGVEYEAVCDLAAGGEVEQLKEYIREACSSKGRQLGPETFWHKGKASPLVLTQPIPTTSTC